MGILDDAIKEHLELKRQHGADASELKQLEDEAFGAAERPGSEGSIPDPLAEAPTEFMSQPDLAQPAEPKAEDEGTSEPIAPAAEEPSSRRSPRAEIADLQEAPQSPPEERAEEPEEPAEEEPPATDIEPEPKISPGPSTEEREAIAEQPTEMFDVEEELAGSEPPAPSEEELVEEEMSEPRLAPVDPLSGLDEDGADEEADDFFDDKRLSDELDQALEAPSEVEEEPEWEAEPEEEEPEAEEPPPAKHEEDVLEETPDFLEEAPEDDQLWFEQKPPKDFDFDD